MISSMQLMVLRVDLRSLFLVFVLIPTFLSAQISTTKVPKIEPATDLTPSNAFSRNFQGSNVRNYIGQKLYLKGVSETLRKYEYKGFYSDSKGKKTYRKNGGGVLGYSDYEYMTGRYYKVLDALKHDSFGKHFLKLQDEESSEIIYFEYNTRFEHSFPFIAVPYFEAIENKYKGAELVFSRRALDSIKPLSQSSKVNQPNEDAWTCTGVTVDETYYALSLLLQNRRGDQSIIPVSSLFNEKKRLRSAFLASEANDFSERFGEDAWRTILNGKVKVGFTEEMVRLAWGTPNSINRASYGNQWVYQSQYLYFEKGIMTSFN